MFLKYKELVYGLLFGVGAAIIDTKRERHFRQLTETLERFHRELCAPALLMHTRLQVLLTRQDFHLSRDAEEAVRFVYERSQEIQALTKEKLPLQGSS